MNFVKLAGSPRKLGAFFKIIPDEYMLALEKGTIGAIGFESETGIAVGVAIIKSGNRIQGETDKNIVLEYVYIKPEYRREGIFGLFLEEMAVFCQKNRFSGLIASILHPKMSSVENVLTKTGFYRLKDGNIIFRLKAEDFYGTKIIPNDKRKVLPISSFEKMSSQEVSAFLREAGNKYPKSLSVSALPGEWSKRLSYLYMTQNEIGGYLLCSVLDEKTLYIGSFFLKKKHTIASVLLIDRLICDLENESKIKEIVMTPVSGEARSFARHIIKMASATPEISVVYNYYKEFGRD
ncbi:MAG: hypothetical protein K6F00_03595 [Lachnospiraceae bacterium]|nr:hypothetical protein [Lachnospiraceae bacterium]